MTSIQRDQCPVCANAGTEREAGRQVVRRVLAMLGWDKSMLKRKMPFTARQVSCLFSPPSNPRTSAYGGDRELTERGGGWVLRGLFVLCAQGACGGCSLVRARCGSGCLVARRPVLTRPNGAGSCGQL